MKRGKRDTVTFEMSELAMMCLCAVTRGTPAAKSRALQEAMCQRDGGKTDPSGLICSDLAPPT